MVENENQWVELYGTAGHLFIFLRKAITRPKPAAALAWLWPTAWPEDFKSQSWGLAWHWVLGFHMGTPQVTFSHTAPIPAYTVPVMGTGTTRLCNYYGFFTSSCSYIMMYYTNRYRWIAISAVLTVHTVSCTHHNGVLLLDMGQLWYVLGHSLYGTPFFSATHASYDGIGLPYPKIHWKTYPNIV